MISDLQNVNTIFIQNTIIIVHSASSTFIIEVNFTGRERKRGGDQENLDTFVISRAIFCEHYCNW